MTEAEAAVGITCFANDSPGFKAILKHRYADFKVNEIGLDGQVVRLTCLDPPPPKAAAPAEEPAGEAAALDPAAAVEAAVQQYEAASGSTRLEPLRAFLQAAQKYHAAATAASGAEAAQDGGGQGRGRGGRGKPRIDPAVAALAPAPVVLDPLADKAARTAVHRLFRELSGGPGGFPGMETNTVERPAPAAADAAADTPAAADQQGGQQKQGQAAKAGDGAASGSAAGSQQCIQVEVSGAGGGGGGRGRGGRGGRGQKRKWRDNSGWPGGVERKYVRFVLHKENMDSQQAIASLCKMLRVGHKLFSVAGTKDKRGVTTQRVTAYMLDPSRLAALNSRLRGMRVGNFDFCAEQLRLGDLQGNRFELVLRGVEAASPEAVSQAAEGLRSSGFVNYYGLQRFGTGAVPTHRVGQALLRGRWREAVRLLLTPRADCPRSDQVEASRLYLEEGDVEGALRLMPRFLVAEPALLLGLKQNGPNGFLNALMGIPRNLRTMYIHAYQSFLWNAAASHRVQTYAVQGAVAGDLVLPHETEAQRAMSRNRVKDRKARQEGQGGEAGGSRAGGSTAGEAGPEEEAALPAEAGEEEGAEEEAFYALAVHVVTAEEAASGKYGIGDVVLPLPGAQTRLPENSVADVYRRVAAGDGVSLDSSPHGTQEFSMAALAGAYRRVVHRPADLECELLRYSHPDADLAATDLMALEGRSLPPPVDASDPQGGRYLGVRLAFSLPSSCYATMLIRELTKQPTGAEHHKALPHQPGQADGAAAEGEAVDGVAAAEGAEQQQADQPGEEKPEEEAEEQQAA